MVVTLVKSDSDAQWFSSYPNRQSHIRKPTMILETNSQRGTRYVDECAGEFFSLGDHNKDRRRILLWKVPKDNIFYDPRKPQILKIPFLLNSDETVEDRDDILLPILQEIMMDAARK